MKAYIAEQRRRNEGYPKMRITSVTIIDAGRAAIQPWTDEVDRDDDPLSSPRLDTDETEQGSSVGRDS